MPSAGDITRYIRFAAGKGQARQPGRFTEPAQFQDAGAGEQERSRVDAAVTNAGFVGGLQRQRRLTDEAIPDARYARQRRPFTRPAGP